MHVRTPVSSAIMEFLLLGPVYATVDGAAVELGRPRERLLLSLLLEAVEPLAVDRLIELLWDDDLPRDPCTALPIWWPGPGPPPIPASSDR
jgi:hypothetical protein